MKKTPMRRVSKKRAKDNKLYAKLRVEYLDHNPVCEACHQNRAIHIHHKKGTMYGLKNEVKYWMAICLYCHAYIHNHPEAARKSGWLLDRLGNL